MTARRYKVFKERVQALKLQKRLPVEPPVEQYIDWVYGTTVIENPRITWEIAEAAVRRKVLRAG
jgi:hypothetical protein